MAGSSPDDGHLLQGFDPELPEQLLTCIAGAEEGHSLLCWWLVLQGLRLPVLEAVMLTTPASCLSCPWRLRLTVTINRSSTSQAATTPTPLARSRYPHYLELVFPGHSPVRGMP